MSFSQIIGTVARRWYLVLLGVLVSAGLAYLGTQYEPPQYQASGTILLLPSKDQMSAGGRNPYLQLTNLDSVANIVMARLNGDDVVTRYEEASPNAEFYIQSDTSLRGPTIQVTVVADTETDSLRILQSLLDDATQTLKNAQAEQKVPKAAAVSSMLLVADTRAEMLLNDTLRTSVAAGAAGLLGTVLMVFALDGLLARRTNGQGSRWGRPRRRRKPAESTTAVEDASAESTDEADVAIDPEAGPEPASAASAETPVEGRNGSSDVDLNDIDLTDIDLGDADLGEADTLRYPDPAGRR